MEGLVFGEYLGKNNPEIAREYSKVNNVTTLLKGPLTWITNGEQVHVNSFGSPVLARGGSGDLLTRMKQRSRERCRRCRSGRRPSNRQARSSS